jgi:hypothetical protein
MVGLPHLEHWSMSLPLLPHPDLRYLAFLNGRTVGAHPLQEIIQTNLAGGALPSAAGADGYGFLCGAVVDGGNELLPFALGLFPFGFVPAPAQERDEVSY